MSVTAETARARALVSAKRMGCPEDGDFVVRLWDGFDGVWMDVCEPQSLDKCVKLWKKKTNDGTRATSYANIDYYAIYPVAVKMVFDADNPMIT